MNGYGKNRSTYGTMHKIHDLFVWPNGVKNYESVVESYKLRLLEEMILITYATNKFHTRTAKGKEYYRLYTEFGREYVQKQKVLIMKDVFEYLILKLMQRWDEAKQYVAQITGSISVGDHIVLDPTFLLFYFPQTDFRLVDLVRMYDVRYNKTKAKKLREGVSA